MAKTGQQITLLWKCGPPLAVGVVGLTEWLWCVCVGGGYLGAPAEWPYWRVQPHLATTTPACWKTVEKLRERETQQIWDKLAFSPSKAVPASKAIVSTPWSPAAQTRGRVESRYLIRKLNGKSVLKVRECVWLFSRIPCRCARFFFFLPFPSSTAESVMNAGGERRCLSYCSRQSAFFTGHRSLTLTVMAAPLWRPRSNQFLSCKRKKKATPFWNLCSQEIEGDTLAVMSHTN